MPPRVTRPAIEGSVAVGAGRRLGFAEYGCVRGPAVVWMHGTPGGRRQVPLDARAHALEHGLRIIGIDRPGIGSSTPHLYDELIDWAGDLEIVLNTLGIDEVRLVGLSGGGPYVLAAGAAMPERVSGVAVLGGVAPTVGSDAVEGGIMQYATHLAPLITTARVPLGFALTRAIRLARPLAGQALNLYARLQPPGDKALLAQPAFKAMFLDDLLNAARFQVTGPLSDLVLFSRYWGFDLADVVVPVAWFHGDGDHIVPLDHGEHCASLLPRGTLSVMDGLNHLGGLGVAAEVLGTLMALDG